MRLVAGSNPAFPTIYKGEKMIQFYIYEQNTRTRKNTFLDYIEAVNIREAREAYIKKAKWEPRRHVKLVVRTPPMR